jgi:hypothetical protein
MDAIDEGELVLDSDVPTLLGSNKERRNGGASLAPQSSDAPYSPG